MFTILISKCTTSPAPGQTPSTTTSHSQYQPIVVQDVNTPFYPQQQTPAYFPPSHAPYNPNYSGQAEGTIYHPVSQSEGVDAEVVYAIAEPIR